MTKEDYKNTTSPETLSIINRRMELDRKKRLLQDIANENCDRIRKAAENSPYKEKQKLEGYVRDFSEQVERLSRLPDFEKNPDLFIQNYRTDSQRILDSLDRSIKRKNNVLDQVGKARNAVRVPSYSTSILGNFESKPEIHRSSKQDVLAAQRGDIGTRRGKVSQGYIDRVKDSDGDHSYQAITNTYKSALHDAQGQVTNEVSRDFARLHSLSKRGVDLNEYDQNRFSTRIDEDYKPRSLGNSIAGTVAQKARRLSKKSTYQDSKSYQKFVKKRDDIFRSLSAEMNPNGITSSIMREIETLLSQPGAINDNGMMDQLTFSRILSLLNDQRRNDKQGISEEVMKQINNLNESAVKLANDEAKNEDSVVTMRIIQLLLLLAPILGIPLLGTIVSGAGSAIFGSGLGAGIPELMTADFLGPIGAVADAIELDVAAGWLLENVPIVNSFVGGIDYVLLSEPGQAFAAMLNGSGDGGGLLGSPLIPIAAAVGFSMYMAGNTKHNKKKDDINKKFKQIDKALDSIKQQNKGKFNFEKEGGELADDEKRLEFVSQKYDILRNSQYIRSLSDFVEAVSHASCSDEEVNASFEEVFSPQLCQYFASKNVFVPGFVSDTKSSVDAIAELFYCDSENSPHLMPLKEELEKKFGIFFKEFKSNDDNLAAAVNGLSQIAKDDERSGAISREGKEIYDAFFDLNAAKDRGGISFDEGLVDAISDYSPSEIESLKAEAEKSRGAVIEQESEHIRQIIAQYKGEGLSSDGSELSDLMSYNRPGFSPLYKPTGSEITGLNRGIRV